MAEPATVCRTLERYGQEHLLHFYEQLAPSQQAALLEQIAGIDFSLLEESIETYVRHKLEVAPKGHIGPPRVISTKPANKAQASEHKKAIRRGRKLVAAGKVAAFMVAGGQGTRLGHEGPKGCLEATPVTHKPLFQVYAEQIQAAARRGNATIPFYVMTSPDNDVATRAFFRQHNYFGLAEADVFFLVQGTMPTIDFNGKLLLAAKDSIDRSPNGHGGCLKALRDSGALADMARRGVELISYFQVDNPLVHSIDPLFLGLHDLRDAEMSVKVLSKRDPMEKLGNVCQVDGRLTVIEYSDLPEELARRTTEDGRLRFSAGSIAIHVLSRSFVERLTEGPLQLPFHRAEKNAPYLDEKGQLVCPTEPNAIKLEMFVFDALPLAERTLVLETIRSEEFSPIKNAEGSDSLVTSLHDQVRRAAEWLEQADLTVPRDADGQVAAAIEISPLFADSAEALQEKIDPELKITAGQNLYLGSRGQTGGLR